VELAHLEFAFSLAPGFSPVNMFAVAPKPFKRFPFLVTEATPH
jgi:hypothetical protein